MKTQQNTHDKKLGRGLSALLGESKVKRFGTLDEQSNSNQTAIEQLEISKIVAGVYQPRKHFSQEEIEDLANSIKESGIIQPIIVRSVNKGQYYEIIAGERRFRASQLAGLESVPAIVKKINNHEALELAIVENVQRSDLSATEEAAGYQQLIHEFSYTQEQISKRIGKSRSHVTNLLRLLSLPQETQDLLNQKLISMGHARAIIKSHNPSLLATRIVEEELSVREVEDLVRDEKIDKARDSEASLAKLKTKIEFIKSDELLKIEQDLCKALDSLVKISYNSFKKNGKITIKFHDVKELKKITKNLKK